MTSEPDDRPAPGTGCRTSTSLLERIRNRDQDAWSRTVALYTPLVCHWCARRGVVGPDADDLAQEVFQAALTGLDRFRRDRPGDSFRAWLGGITRNVLRTHLQRQGAQPQARGGTDALVRLRDVADRPSPADSEEDEPSEARALYRRALDLVRGDFEERTWQMFWQTGMEGRAPTEVAAEMGVTPAAVRKAKSRVLHRLKQEVGDLLD
jgi:RNA polymerase sigma-70 factor (ECF subfamily)